MVLGNLGPVEAGHRETTFNFTYKSNFELEKMGLSGGYYLKKWVGWVSVAKKQKKGHAEESLQAFVIFDPKEKTLSITVPAQLIHDYSEPEDYLEALRAFIPGMNNLNFSLTSIPKSMGLLEKETKKLEKMIDEIFRLF